MKRNHRWMIGAATAALMTGAVVAAAQDVRAPEPPRPPRPPHIRVNFSDAGVAKIDTLVSFSPNGSVELSLINGSIKVSTWNRNQVRVVATSTGGPLLEFDASSNHIDLEQTRGWRNRMHDNAGSATYDVTVPVGTRTTLSAVSGSIDAAGVHGPMDVSAVSARVAIRDAGTSVSIEGVSGEVTVTDVGGDLRAETVSAPISASNIAGTASAETVSGPITLNGVRGLRAQATTVSGDLDFNSAINPSGRYDFETHSGRATLRLGGNASANITVDTFSGSVSVDYPGAVRRSSGDGDDDRTYNYTIGRGGARIRVESFSGRVQVTQGNR